MANPDRRRAQLADVRAFLGEVFGTDLHVKRVDSEMVPGNWTGG